MENIIFGRRPVYEFFEHEESKGSKNLENIIEEIFITKSIPQNLINKINTNLPKNKIKICERTIIDKIFPNINHQGVVIKFNKNYKINSFEKSLDWKTFVTENRGLIIILDALQDIQNVGSIVRSVEAIGAKCLFITGKGVRLNHLISKSSSGANFFINIYEVTNLFSLCLTLKKLGFWICSSSSQKDFEDYKKNINLNQKVIKNEAIFLFQNEFDKLPATQDLALIIGSEGDGVRSLILSESDFILSIKMSGKISSLNAGVAAGILLDRIINR